MSQLELAGPAGRGRTVGAGFIPKNSLKASSRGMARQLMARNGPLARRLLL